ncbi:MAG TPA: glutamine amidotransferase [Bauldia sp.]
MAPRQQQKAGLRVLIAGESWVTHSIHQKGFDSFTTTEYVEAVEWLRAALEGGGIAVDYQPAHVAARSFPATPRALAGYNCVILSDIGANTLLLHPDTFVRSRPLPNRLAAIREYVRAGGGLVMVGGYLSFQGIEAKARYHTVRRSRPPCRSRSTGTTTASKCRRASSHRWSMAATQSSRASRAGGR